jgi:hypothetical protein
LLFKNNQLETSSHHHEKSVDCPFVDVAEQSHTLNFINDHLVSRKFVMNIWLTLAVVIVILWLVGFFALPGVGALIHILLVIAVILVLVWLLTGRKMWKRL